MYKQEPLSDKVLKVGIVCCSNGQTREHEKTVKALETALRQLGMEPVFSPYIYERDSVFSGTAKERADSLMEFYRDTSIRCIFDISGGDIANEVLPYLDYEWIARSNKSFWGYSDLTTIINAIYTKTGKASVLYQIRNLVYGDSERQQANFQSLIWHGNEELFQFRYRFVQRERMSGVVVGGNIRCLLKLAGTPYWPDMKDKLLLLEGYGGVVPQMVTYLNQLTQIGVFGQINGIILGTFTNMEQEGCAPGIVELVKQYAGNSLPIVKTDELGHGIDSKGVIIGKELILEANSRN
ncbi:MAG: LD-carboxypeptidase [Dorea sp.]|jgi:muramoyltetrapeptide carboxypeptidase|nr:LD-carboxypeptidase [Dorea sp.]